MWSFSKNSRKLRKASVWVLPSRYSKKMSCISCTHIWYWDTVILTCIYMCDDNSHMSQLLRCYMYNSKAVEVDLHCWHSFYLCSWLHFLPFTYLKLFKTVLLCTSKKESWKKRTSYSNNYLYCQYVTSSSFLNKTLFWFTLKFINVSAINQPLNCPLRVPRASTIIFSTALRSALEQWGGRLYPRMLRPVRTREERT